jgi:hypothetical protein
MEGATPPQESAALPSTSGGIAKQGASDCSHVKVVAKHLCQLHCQATASLRSKKKAKYVN